MVHLPPKRKGYTQISATNFFNDLDISRNAFRKQKKDSSSEVFTESEVRMIIHYIDGNPTIRNLVILLAFQTGMRIGEIAALKRQDIHFQAKSIHVQRTEIYYSDDNGKSMCTVSDFPKTENGDRYILVNDSCLLTIRKILQINPFTEYLFEERGSRIRGNALRRSLYRICDKLEIPRRSPHKIRKTYATCLIDANTSESLIQTQMGHKDITTTRKYYYFNNQDKSEKRQQIQRAISW